MTELPQMHGEDLMNLMCGNLLGSGQYRHVYSGKQDASLVFKYERTFERCCNRAEMELWVEMQDHPLGKWLAPCVALSPDGTWLIQRRTEPLQFSQLPEKIPKIFCDAKIENWGMFEGRVVCHDYGNNNMLYALARRYGVKLETVTWRGRS
jgi:hypothetical protein